MANYCRGGISMDFEKEKILKNVEGNIILWRHGIITPSAALNLIYKSIHEPRGDYGDNIRCSPSVKR